MEIKKMYGRISISGLHRLLPASLYSDWKGKAALPFPVNTEQN